MNNHRELLSYFNLTGLPFTKEIPVDQLHLLPSVERNLAAAGLLLDTRGIGAITGKPGTGKSCLLRLLQHRLHAGLYRTFYLCHSSVGTVEFYTHLSVLFGLQPNYRRAAMFRDIKQHVLGLNNSAHIHPVLLIDEAHLLSTEILSEIRLLTLCRPTEYAAWWSTGGYSVCSSRCNGGERAARVGIIMAS